MKPLPTSADYEWPPRALLGECDICGEPVIAGCGHLYKQPDGAYACEHCDIVTRVKEGNDGRLFT